MTFWAHLDYLSVENGSTLYSFGWSKFQYSRNKRISPEPFDNIVYDTDNFPNRTVG